jgi:hypothetical protein
MGLFGVAVKLLGVLVPEPARLVIGRHVRLDVVTHAFVYSSVSARAISGPLPEGDAVGFARGSLVEDIHQVHRGLAWQPVTGPVLGVPAVVARPCNRPGRPERWSLLPAEGFTPVSSASTGRMRGADVSQAPLPPPETSGISRRSLIETGLSHPGVDLAEYPPVIFAKYIVRSPSVCASVTSAQTTGRSPSR